MRHINDEQTEANALQYEFQIIRSKLNATLAAVNKFYFKLYSSSDVAKELNKVRETVSLAKTLLNDSGMEDRLNNSEVIARWNNTSTSSKKFDFTTRMVDVFPEHWLRGDTIIFDETNIVEFGIAFTLLMSSNASSGKVVAGVPFSGSDVIKIEHGTRIDHLEIQPTYQQGQLILTDVISFTYDDDVREVQKVILDKAKKQRIYKNTIIMVHPHSLKFDAKNSIYNFRFGISEYGAERSDFN